MCGGLIVLSSDAFKESAKEAIRANTREIENGSGKMWITPVLEVERIRTGEINEAALAHPVASKKKNLHESFYTVIDTPAS